MSNLSLICPLAILSKGSLDFIHYLLSVVTRIEDKYSFKAELVIVYSSLDPAFDIDSLIASSHIQLIKDSQNGIYSAWNDALASSKYEYICIVGFGDLVQLEFICTCLSIASAYSDSYSRPYLIFTAKVLVSKHGKLIQRCNYTKSGRITSQIFTRSYICHSGSIISKRLYSTLFQRTSYRLRIFRDLHFLYLVQDTIGTSSLHFHLNCLQVVFEGSGISSTSSYFKRLYEKCIVALATHTIPFLLP